MPNETVALDVLILGGGVAGLWTAHALAHEGHRVAVLEPVALGAGQTAASQGIIHGGLKYSLQGVVTRATASIADMPARWAAALAGQSGPDLRNARVLSPRYWLWTAPGLASRIAGVAAAAAIRTDVARAPRDDRPPGLAAAPAGVDVYSVEEPVLDPASLSGALARAAGALLLHGEPTHLSMDDRGARVVARAAHGPDLTLHAQALVLAAGAANEHLLSTLGLGHSAPRMQRRPLHMVMARGDLPAMFAHAVSASPTPRLTITSQTDARGRTVWYIGGALAESGVERSTSDQLAAARAELRNALPWIDTSRAELAALRIDRAEGRTPAGARPDGPVVQPVGRAVVLWPTKLAFAPAVGDLALAALGAMGVRPSGRADPREAPAAAPPVADLPWDQPGVAWT